MTGPISSEDDDVKRFRPAWRALAHASSLLLLGLPGSAQREALRGAEDGPEPGDLAPEVTVFDEQGKEVQLRTLLRGHYTAIVLGCLT